MEDDQISYLVGYELVTSLVLTYEISSTLHIV